MAIVFIYFIYIRTCISTYIFPNTTYIEYLPNQSMASRSDKPTHSNWDDLQADEVTHGDRTSSRFLNTLQMHDHEFSYNESTDK